MPEYVSFLSIQSSDFLLRELEVLYIHKQSARAVLLTCYLSKNFFATFLVTGQAQVSMYIAEINDFMRTCNTDRSDVWVPTSDPSVYRVLFQEGNGYE